MNIQLSHGSKPAASGTSHELGYGKPRVQAKNLVLVVKPINHVLPEGAYWVGTFKLVTKSPLGANLSTTEGYESVTAARRSALEKISKQPDCIFDVVRDCRTTDGRILNRLREIIVMQEE